MRSGVAFDGSVRLLEMCAPALLALAALTSGCVVEPVDLTNRRCPCARGFTCLEATQTCCEPAVRAEGFQAAWATANVIRWEWQPVGDGDHLVRYELEVAERPEDLGTDRARIITPDENPELGGFVLERTGGDGDVVTATMTFDHDPRTTYVGRLIATDTDFCPFRSEVAAISTTLDPPETIPLFRDRSSMGGPFPDSIAVVDDGMGGARLEHTPSRDPECVESGEGVCSQNLRWNGFDVPASAISQGEFANTAMVEVQVANVTDTPSFYSRVWLQVADRLFRLEPFTYRNGPDYRTYQVPLHALVDARGRALDHTFLAESRLFEFNVGGQWSRCAAGESPPGCVGGRVLIRQAQIRY